ncbi:MAG TPA: helix-turn-helix domain-containing protein [Kofleriaceae bacterium]|nr:helix-turn-helix domain-containing protein [Kofleriaceae bacterium]
MSKPVRRGRRLPTAVIDSLPRLRALISPARQEIVDTLQALGRASIAELATRLGRPSDGLYYHVRALVKAGLVVAAGQRAAGRRDERIYTTLAPGRSLRLRYRPRHRASAAALRRLVGSMLRTAERDFGAGLARPGVVVEGRRRALWAGRSKGWLSPAELERVNQLLAELGGLLSSGPSRARGQLFALTYVLAPADARPPRRGRKS